MSNVKKPSYVNCDSNTLIKNIPNIINTNNEENIKFFKSIFEFGGINNKSQTQQYSKVPLITKGIAGPHKLQGMGANFIPETLDLSVIDEIIPS